MSSNLLSYPLNINNAKHIIDYIMKDFLNSSTNTQEQERNKESINIIFNSLKKLQLDKSTNKRNENNEYNDNYKIEYIKKYLAILENSNIYKELFKYFIATYIIKYSKDSFVVKIGEKEYTKLQIIVMLKSSNQYNVTQLDSIIDLIINTLSEINIKNKNIYNNALFSGLDLEYKILIIKLAKLKKESHTNN